MLFCAWRTSDAVIDRARDDHKASRTFRELQGLVAPFSLRGSGGVKYSYISEEKYIRYGCFIQPRWSEQRVMFRTKDIHKDTLTKRAFQEFLTLNSFWRLFVDLFSSFATRIQIVLPTAGDIRQDDIFFQCLCIGLRHSVQLQSRVFLNILLAVNSEMKNNRCIFQLHHNSVCV